MDQIPLGTILYCIGSLFVGGLFKGVAGLGLPLIGVPLLTLALTLKSAIAVLIFPLITSNLFQSFEGGLFYPMVRRFWPLYAVLFFVIVVSTRLLIAVPERYLFAAIGVALIVFPSIAHLMPNLRIRPEQERWMAPLTGLIAGVIGGISTYYGAALMLYVVWLRLPKDLFVVAISQMFTVASIGLALGLLIFGGTGAAQFGISALACLPVLGGLMLGQRVRLRMSERRFALLILWTYLLTGASFLVRLA